MVGIKAPKINLLKAARYKPSNINQICLKSKLTRLRYHFIKRKLRTTEIKLSIQGDTCSDIRII